MVHRISATLDIRKLMTKEEYDPNNDGKISLGIIDIDRDLNMGSHNIVIDNGYKIDGIDISEHTHSLSITSFGLDPTLYSHSNVSGGVEYLVAEINHNFNTPHAIITHRTYLKNTGSVSKGFWVKVYINGEEKTSHYFTLAIGGERTVTYGDVVEIETQDTYKVEIKVLFEEGTTANLEGKKLITESYSLGKPQ